MNLIIDLKGNFFVEFNGGYHYVDEANISGGGASADIDASSWSAGAGIGLRF